MHDGWRLGRPFGIPVVIHTSWLLIFGLVVWSLASDYLPMHQPGVSGAASLGWAVAAALLFFGSVLAHELAHSLLARARGVPVEGITLFALGGVSHLRRDATRPSVELTVALVGPLTSLALAGLFWALWRVATPWNMSVAAIAFYLAYGNAVLGLFNLIPGFPLDGGRVLRALVWARTGDVRRASAVAIGAGRLAAGALVAVGMWQTFDGGRANGLWLILVAWYLWGAAEREGWRVRVEGALAGRTVASFVKRPSLVLDADASVAQAAERISSAPEQPLYLVLGQGRLLGALRPRDIQALPVERQRSTSVNWLTRRTVGVRSLRLETSAVDALATLEALRTDALPVADAEGRPVGTFEREAVARWLMSASAVEP